MSIPDWWTFALLALAAYRLWSLLAEDDLTSELRLQAVTWVERKTNQQRADALYDFATCPWCCGWWIALGWWLAYQLWEHATVAVAVPFALSVGVGALASVLRKD